MCGERNLSLKRRVEVKRGRGKGLVGTKIL
jgi:hypothetical protein